VTISFFALFGFIFLITQAFQFFRGYSPLSAGVHMLPVATSVAVASIVGTRLAVKVGTKAIVAIGMLLMAAFYIWVAETSITVAYAVVFAQMVIFGTGMGLTSAPATEAIMGAVSTAKAGVGSAVNDTTRLLGGTLGVAVLGSVFASLYGGRINTLLGGGAVPPRLVAAAHSSAGEALGLAQRLGHTPLAARIHDAAHAAFIHGFDASLFVAAGVTAAGAVIALLLLPAQPGQRSEAVSPRPAAAVSAVAAE
jgi:hypothetical protein